MKTSGISSIFLRQFLALLLAVQFMNLSIEPRSLQAMSRSLSVCSGEIESIAELVAEVVWDIDASFIEHGVADETQQASADSVTLYFSFHHPVRVQSHPPDIILSFRSAFDVFGLSREQDVSCPPPKA